MNQVNLMGRLTKDPEITELSGGIKLAKTTIAITRRFDNSKTDFIPLVFWRNQAEYIENYGRKGIRVLITGRLEINQIGEKENYKTFTQVIVENIDIINDTKQKEELDTSIPAALKRQEKEIEESTNKPTNETAVPWELEL